MAQDDSGRPGRRLSQRRALPAAKRCRESGNERHAILLELPIIR